MMPTFSELPPDDEELSAGLAGLPGAPPRAAAPAPAAPASPPPAAVRWLTDKKRTQSFDLEYPLEVGGIEYRTVTVQRLTVAEVEGFMTRIRAAPDAPLSRYPMFHAHGAELPDAVWASLDDDDRFALGEIATDFLPARFRQPKAAPAG